MAWTRNSPLALLALAGLWGCGVYSFRGSLPAHIDSIAVSNVINQTSEFVLTDLTNELITNLFLTENVLRVTDLSNADSDLQVTINRITDTPSTFTAGESVQEWQINVSTKVIWYDLARNRPLFEKSFSAVSHYAPGGDEGSDQIDNDGDGEVDEEDEFGDPREAALRRLLEKIANDILNEIVSTW